VKVNRDIAKTDEKTYYVDSCSLIAVENASPRELKPLSFKARFIVDFVF
jgi:hypothetical protein